MGVARILARNTDASLPQDAFALNGRQILQALCGRPDGTGKCVGNMPQTNRVKGDTDPRGGLVLEYSGGDAFCNSDDRVESQICIHYVCPTTEVRLSVGMKGNGVGWLAQRLQYGYPLE